MSELLCTSFSEESGWLSVRVHVGWEFEAVGLRHPSGACILTGACITRPRGAPPICKPASSSLPILETVTTRGGGIARRSTRDRCCEPPAAQHHTAASVLGVQSIAVERHDQLGGLWFVRLQPGLFCILPASDLDDACGDLSLVCASCRLHNIEAAAIEKERMFPKDLTQVVNRWMIIRKHLSVELTEGLFDPCGCKPHLTCPFA